jgi:hypothetical protein
LGAGATARACLDEGWRKLKPVAANEARRRDFGAICKQGRQALADARPDYSSVSLTLFMPNGRHQREAEHHEEADESAQRSQDTTGVIGVHQAA